MDYCYADNNGTLPESGQCIKKDAPETLSTQLPVDDICARVQRRTKLPVITSDDAGRFLCEFIYYQSLFIDPKRTVFIHIPDLDDKFTVESLAETIQLIIYELLRDVDPLPSLNQHGNYLINPNVKKNTNGLDLNLLS
jgi:pyroglutamyl-peptidase